MPEPAHTRLGLPVIYSTSSSPRSSPSQTKINAAHGLVRVACATHTAGLDPAHAMQKADVFTQLGPLQLFSISIYSFYLQPAATQGGKSSDDASWQECWVSSTGVTHECNTWSLESRQSFMGDNSAPVFSYFSCFASLSQTSLQRCWLIIIISISQREKLRCGEGEPFVWKTLSRQSRTAA